MLLSRANRTFGSAIEKFMSNSRGSFLGTYAFRQRYPTFNKSTHDPVLTDFFAGHFIKQWYADPPSYNYWVQMTIGFTLAILSISRHLFFNPDVYVRHQEMRKPQADRVRQHAYSLPFFNHQVRNRCCKYRRVYVDNEPDFADNHELGYRPNRKQVPGRMYCVFSCSRYAEEDPWYTTSSHANMSKMYQDLGYSKI